MNDLLIECLYTVVGDWCVVDCGAMFLATVVTVVVTFKRYAFC